MVSLSLARPLAGLAALLGLAGAGVPAAAAVVAIDHVVLIDGTGTPPQPDMTVTIDGERIVSVRPSSASGAPRADRRIDGRGRWLIPGLMDVHIHLVGWRPGARPEDPPVVDHAEAEAALASFLYDGVTTVLDVGNQPQNSLYERARERAGEILSPRIFATGNLVTYPGSHGDAMAVRVSDFEKDRAVLERQLAEQKPDVLKITYDEEGWGARPMITLMPEPLLRQVIMFYNLNGVRTTVHVSNERRSLEAVFAGADTLAHPVIQGPVSDSFVRLMAAKKIPFATTLTIGENYSRLVEHPEYLDAPDYRASFSPAEIAELKTTTREAWRPRVWTAWMKLMTPIAEENVRKIVRAGGVAALGTDQSSGPATHREMELLVQAGLTPLEVIRIATRNAAVFLGRGEDLGEVAPGKLADLVLLAKDPSLDVDNTKAIVFVMKGGRIIDESRLPLAGGPRPRRWDGPLS